MAARTVVAFVAVVAQALGAFSASANDLTRPFDTAQLPLSERPYVELAALDTNAVNSFRMLVPADESSGVAQILALVSHTNFEEQWVFVPAIDLWIEIGKNESASELDSQVETDVEYLKQIVSRYRTVQIFHFHPADFYARAWQQEPFSVEFAADAVAAGDLRPIGYALPSSPDVVASIQLSEILFEVDPLASVTHTVVSPHGLVTYGPTTLGLQRMLNEEGHPRATIARDIITYVAIRRMEYNIGRTIEALGTPTIGEVIQELCLQSSDENYVISFTAF